MAQANPTGYSFSQLYVWGTARGHLLGVIGRGIGMASSFFIVTVLSVYHYGLYQLVLAVLAVSESSIFNLFDDVAGNDLARALADKKIPLAKRLFHEVLLWKIILGVVISGTLFLGAGLFASYYSKDIASFIRILSILALVRMIRASQGMLFGAILSFATFGAGVLQESIRLLLLLGFWRWSSFGLREVLLSTVLASTAVLVYTSFFFAREYSAVFRGVSAEKIWVFPRIVRSFGKWIFIRQGFSNAVKSLDSWFIRIFLNTEAVGLYALAINLLTIIQKLFPTRMLSGLLPWEVVHPGRLQYIYRRGIKYFLWSGVIVAIATFFAVPFLVGLLLPKYLPAMPIFRLMALTLPLYGIYKFQKILLIVLREQKVLTMRLITETLATAILWVVALPLIGLYAAVPELMLTYIWRVAYFSRFLQKHPHLSLKLKHLVLFDRNDLEFFKKAFYEASRPARWFKPVRALAKES